MDFNLFQRSQILNYYYIDSIVFIMIDLYCQTEMNNTYQLWGILEYRYQEIW